MNQLKRQSRKRSGCMSRKRNNYEKYNIEMPLYCKECGKCKSDSEADENLKIVNNTGWTRDIYCRKLLQIVHRI